MSHKRRGGARQGMARQGKAGHGKARQTVVSRSEAHYFRPHMKIRVGAGHGEDGRGGARQGKAEFFLEK